MCFHDGVVNVNVVVLYVSAREGSSTTSAPPRVRSRIVVIGGFTPTENEKREGIEGKKKRAKNSFFFPDDGSRTFITMILVP